MWDLPSSFEQEQDEISALIFLDAAWCGTHEMVYEPGRALLFAPYFLAMAHPSIPPEFYDRLWMMIRASDSKSLRAYEHRVGFTGLSKILKHQQGFWMSRIFRILRVHPGLSANWLLLGEGPQKLITTAEWQQMIADYQSIEQENLRLAAKVEMLQEIISELTKTSSHAT